MEKKYGPKKVGAKVKDRTSDRYKARRAQFGPITHAQASKGVGPQSGAPRPTPRAPRATFTPGAAPRTPRTQARSYTPRPAPAFGRAYTPKSEGRTPAPSRTYTPRTGAPRAYTPRTSTRPSFTPRNTVRGAHEGKFGGTARTYTPKPHSGARTYTPKRTGYATPSRTAPYAKPARVLPPKKPRTASSSWGPVAGWYDKHLSSADTYHEKVLLPNLMRLVNPQKGERIVDLACGQGYFTRALHAAQAEVVGIDIGSELIEIAQNSMPDVTFHVGSAESPTMLHDASFDKALISLALQNIEHADRVIVSASRILTPGGELHIVLNHPAFRIPKRTSWGFDRKRMLQYRQVDGYLSLSDSTIDMHPGLVDSPSTISYHRPLQYYFKAFEKAGFAVTRLEEWISHKDSDSGPRAQAENLARKEIPLFLYLRVTKLTSA